MKRAGLVVTLLALAGCTRSTSRDPLTMVPATDLDPDPSVVEVELVAEIGAVEYLAGKPAEVWGYRDASRGLLTVPGPYIEANVGDLVIVRVRNELPETTTVHWHGIRLPQPMDGTNASQTPIMPGETFEYRFVAGDEGTFWYHPHMRADVQIENGLYGALVVKEADPPEAHAERMFVLDDVKLDGDGTLVDAPNTLDYMLGRQGNVILANGAAGATLATRAGRERWRFVNAANGRFFNLDLPGHTFWVIGWDGGRIPVPYEAATLLIAPGERYDVLVDLASDTTLRTLHYDRGHDIPDPGPLTVFDVELSGSSPAIGAKPLAGPPLAPIVTDGSTATRVFTLTEIEDRGDGLPQFLINGEFWPFNTPIGALYGDTEIWEVRNETEMDHPFHLHGMFFQVEGAPLAGWKDTVLVPRQTTVRFAVRYTARGMWMYHCHILEHAELGMMGSLVVTAPGNPL